MFVTPAPIASIAAIKRASPTPVLIGAAIGRSLGAARGRRDRVELGRAVESFVGVADRVVAPVGGSTIGTGIVGREVGGAGGE